jgi:hypothetical protein
VPIGAGVPDWCIVALDTGTTRHGLENSTYNTRAKECAEFSKEIGMSFAQVKDQATYDSIVAK